MTPPIQNQIGDNTTASTPFVTAGDVVYFRGTDDQLWKVNSDGSDQAQVGIDGANTTQSTPVVFDDPVTGEWVYFRGTDDKLWKVRSDGSNLTQIGANTTRSTPFVTFDGATGEVWVYFQGTDDKLWKVKNDGAGSSLTQIGHNTTKSTPFVTFDGTDWWVYFQGTDDKLWKVKNDGAGSSLTQIGHNTTALSPFVIFDVDDGKWWVYFVGTDHIVEPGTGYTQGRLWKVQNDGAGSGLVDVGGNITKSTPFVTPEGWVYFQGTGNTLPSQGSSNRLWKVRKDGTQQSMLGGNTAASAPTVGRVELGAAEVGQWVYFQGTDDKLWRYFDRLDPLLTGTVRPKYYVLTVLYSPPGANDGKSSSLVDYSSGSTTGTKTTTESSWKDEFKSGFGPIGDDVGLGAEFDASYSSTDATAVEIKKSKSLSIKVPGPAKDGIDHDHDVFVLLLNPLLQVTVFPGNNVQQAFTTDGPVMNIQYVYVGWLRNPQAMPPGVKHELDAAGLTTADYAQILSTNPFASGSTTIDTDRYLATPQTFAYEPPYSATDTPWTETYEVDSTSTETSTRTVEHIYTVGVSLSVHALGDLLKFSDTMEWSSKNSTESSQSTEEKASVSVGGPAFGYAGPTDILVYWDTVYKSFMFTFPARPAGGGR